MTLTNLFFGLALGLVYSLRCASVHYSLPTWSSTIG